MAHAQLNFPAPAPALVRVRVRARNRNRNRFDYLKLSLAYITLIFSIPLAHAQDSEANSIDMTGWQQSPLRYHHQKPHDLPLESRFHHDPATDTYTFWVEKGDKPHQPPPNRTAPRSELRLDTNPTTAAAMFDADVFITTGTHTCIMQVFGGSRGPDAMLMVRPTGNIHYGFGDRVLKKAAYEQWVNVKVINYPTTGGMVMIYVDNEKAGSFQCRIDTPHYFKCGAYSVRKGDRSEVKWRNIKYWLKPLDITDANSAESQNSQISPDTTKKNEEQK